MHSHFAAASSTQTRLFFHSGSQSLYSSPYIVQHGHKDPQPPIISQTAPPSLLHPPPANPNNPLICYHLIPLLSPFLAPPSATIYCHLSLSLSPNQKTISHRRRSSRKKRILIKELFSGSRRRSRRRFLSSPSSILGGSQTSMMKMEK